MNTISKLLKEKAVTGKQVARACNVSAAAAHSWIRGANVPNPKYLKALSELANIRYSRLVNARNNSRGYSKTVSPPAKSTVEATLGLSTHDRNCRLLKIASQYATLSNDEKVVVGMMAEALELLTKKKGGNTCL